MHFCEVHSLPSLVSSIVLSVSGLSIWLVLSEMWWPRGHSSKVRCLAWGLDDHFLTTTGADGAVYEWSLRDQRRVRENVIKVLGPHTFRQNLQ